MTVHLPSRHVLTPASYGGGSILREKLSTPVCRKLEPGRARELEGCEEWDSKKPKSLR